MIWRALLINLLLNNRMFWKLNSNFYYKNQKINSVIDSIPEKNYTNRKSTPTPTPLLPSFFKPRNSSFFTGYDERFGAENKTENAFVVMNITKFLMQMKLLNDLENLDISQNDKLKLIETYNKDAAPSKYGQNKESGGLFRDW